MEFVALGLAMVCYNSKSTNPAIGKNSPTALSVNVSNEAVSHKNKHTTQLHNKPFNKVTH